jgi:MGT family glycosyltransferase
VARALFLSLPLTGHTNPSLPLVTELVNRGEEVIYYSSDAFAERIAHTSARFRPYRNAFLRDMSELPDRMEQLAWLLLRTTAEVLQHELEAFRKERPDYLITDSVAPWGQWVGEILGVPVVTSISTFAFNRSVLAFGMRRGVRPKSARILASKIRYMLKAALMDRRLRRAYRVRGPGIVGCVCGRSDLNIVYTSRHFQPCADTFDSHFEFVGPSMAARGETTGFPWGQLTDRPLVYVSLGTLFNADPSFYRKCFDAFSGEDLSVILSTGTKVAPESLGSAPSNFIVRAYVPQLEVLERANAFVSHGGMNSASESLYHGVPLLVIPQIGEQAIVGRRVEQLGAGICFAKEEATPERLRESVIRLLSEESFRQQAAAVGQSFRTSGGVERAALSILKFTRGRRSS